MANLNDREAHNPDGYSTSPLPDGTVTGTNETNVRQGSTPSQVSYRDGYVRGRDVEQRRLDAVQEVRDNDNAARGLLLGILLTGALGLAAAAYFLTQRNDTPVPSRETIVVPRATPVPQQSPQIRERVIERDRVVPVPQQQPVTPSNPAPAPNINITVPQSEAPAPAAPQESAPASSAPASSAPATTQPSAPAATDNSTTPSNSGAPGATVNPQ